MGKIWLGAAVVLLMTAAAFFYFRNFEAAFVTAVLGCVAWFLNFRGQVVRRRDAAQAAKQAEQVEEN